MRKIYITILSLFFFCITKTTAQVGTLYFFSQSNGVYTEITGGTALGTTTSDDQYFVDPAVPAGGTTTTGVGFPIGFSFSYNGNVFDRFAVNNNGWISLGQSSLTPSVSLATTSAYTPLSSTATNTPAILRSRIAGMGRDLQAQAGSELRFETIGSAPNRQLVVQYKNYKRFGTAGTGDNFNFQIIVSETSGDIKVVYGSMIFNTTTTTSTIDHVGLGGSVSTDFNNRQTVAPDNWNATIAGTTNAQGCQNATSTITVIPPASGLTLKWYIPPPCIPGSLVGGTTQGPAGDQCAGSSFSLSVTGATVASGLTYLWESSPDGSTWSTTGVTTQDLTTSTLSNTYYRRRTTCGASNVYSSSALITISAPTTLPLSEGFNTSGTAVFPTCWSQQVVTGTGNITFQTSSTNPVTSPYEGTRYVFWNAFSISSNSETRLVSPAIVTTGVPSIDVQFYWYNENSTSYNSGAYLLEGVQVQYSLNGTTWIDAGSFIPRYDATLPSGTGQWKFKLTSLPAAATNQPVLFVGFKFHSSFGNNCSMDAIKIQSPCAAITNQPASQTVCIGSNTTLSVAATGDGLTYQWRKGGTNLVDGGSISGATTSTLTITSAAAGDAGSYDVVITGTCATVVTSNAVTLSVFPPPTITLQPQNQIVCPATDATFSVTASESGLTYQWRKGGVNLVNGGNISGATSNTLTISAATASNIGTYDVLVTGNCTLASTTATLSLYASPSITTQPVNKIACIGSTATFNVVASGDGLSYQWRKGGIDLTNGGNISGATTNTLTITGVGAGDGASYDVVVTGTCSPSRTSNSVTLTIQNLIAFTTQPANRTSCQNGSVTFTAAGTGTITTTQWQVSTNGGTTWADIAGATTTTLTLTNVQPSQNSYRYRLVLSNAGCGAVNSNAATLTVNPLPTVSLNLSPAGQTQLSPGKQTIVTVSSSPAGASYQWFINGVAEPSITGSSYAVDAHHFGTYTVRVTDVNGCVNTTSGVTLTALPTIQLFMYPNPTSGAFYVTYYMPRVNTPVTLVVIDMMGRRIVERHEVTTGPYTTFDFSNSKLGAGVYIVEFRNSGGQRLAAGQLVVLNK